MGRIIGRNLTECEISIISNVFAYLGLLISTIGLTGALTNFYWLVTAFVLSLFGCVGLVWSLDKFLIKIGAKSFAKKVCQLMISLIAATFTYTLIFFFLPKLQ